MPYCSNLAGTRNLESNFHASDMKRNISYLMLTERNYLFCDQNWILLIKMRFTIIEKKMNTLGPNLEP